MVQSFANLYPSPEFLIPLRSENDGEPSKWKRMKKTFEATFAETLGIDPSLVRDSLAYNSIKEWDSVAHMALINALEENYGIMIETDDVIDMSSVAKAKQILAKYGVDC